MKKLLLILAICYFAGCTQVSKTKGTKTATPTTTPTPTATPTATKPEVYHIVDPQVVGFTLILNFSSVTTSSDKEMVAADVHTAFIESNDGNRLKLELVTKHITNGILKTKKFGLIKLKANNIGYMTVSMTDTQVGLIKTFLGR